MELMPCPHIGLDEHIRASVGGSVAGLLVIGLINLPSISRFISRKSRHLFSSSSSSSSYSSSSSSKKGINNNSTPGSEVDQREEREKAGENGQQRDYKMNFIDHLLGAALVAIMLINIYTRVTRGVTHWLVQPCHYLTAMLIGVTYSPSTNDRLFWFYLYAHWQGYFAFFGGDTSWYETKMELYAFWLQHILMTVVPMYYLLVNRFNTKHSGFIFFLTVYTLTVVYHSLILIPVGYWTMTDFDNMLCPFPGAEGLGRWWREAMAIGSTPFAILVCYLPGVIAHWVHSLLRGRKELAKKKSK